MPRIEGSTIVMCKIGNVGTKKARIFILASLSFVPSPRYFAKLVKIKLLQPISLCAFTERPDTQYTPPPW